MQISPLHNGYVLHNLGNMLHDSLNLKGNMLAFLGIRDCHGCFVVFFSLRPHRHYGNLSFISHNPSLPEKY